MTDHELHQHRAKLWRIRDNPIRTIEDARDFLGSVGFCLMYPERSLSLVPSFFAAYAGSPANVPDARHAFADPRNQPATELMVRLLRSRQAYEINLLPENSLLVAPAFFPCIYALFGDRNPKAAPKGNGRGGTLSPLSFKVFEAIQKQGPASKKQLQALIGRDLSSAAIDRALNELWSILKITRVDYREKEGVFWDLLYRWSPELVSQGSRLSASEAISALLGKYLESVVAATREEIEQFFSHLTAVSKVREAVHALLATRELSFVTVGSKTLIQLTPEPAPHPRRTMDSASPAKRVIIAVDGPAGSGKSTLASLLARKYGYVNIETGAMYRALALKALQSGVSLDDADSLAHLAARSKIELQPRTQGNRVLLDGADVTDRIRQQDVTDAASRVSVHPPVRECMVEQQRQMGAAGGVIMEGRDIGTKVFPHAQVKIFLDASPEVRGSRRFLQQPASPVKEKAVLEELRERDRRDRTRATSPLVPAPDAVIIDSTNLTLDQVFQRAVEIIEKKLVTGP